MILSRHSIARLLLVWVLILLLIPAATASAQSGGVKYTIQEGDTLDSIATSFHTTPGRIRSLNYIADLDYIYPGQRLVIPGFDDVQGEIIRMKLPAGQSLPVFFGSLAQPVVLLNRLNFILSPDQTYIDQALYVMYTDQPPLQRVPVGAGVTGLELAARQGVSEWLPVLVNDLAGSGDLIPNTMLWLPGDETDESVASGGNVLTISPSPMPQGKTITFTYTPREDEINLSGRLDLMINDSLGTSSQYTATSFPLHFFLTEDGSLMALQGIHRFTKPGLTPLVITSEYADGTTFSSQQNLWVREEDYGIDKALTVKDGYMDPEITLPEWKMLKTYFQDAPAQKEWMNPMQPPSPYDDAFTSTFGRLRSYNDSKFIYFHSGVDYQGNQKTPIYAAAAGTVVFTGNLDVRGGATIISHGWGVYTGYWHQSAIDVEVGDHVEAGEVIGMVGDTGRVTGPHLHFEVIVGGIQVDPEDWLQGKK